MKQYAVYVKSHLFVRPERLILKRSDIIQCAANTYIRSQANFRPQKIPTRIWEMSIFFK